MLHITVVGAEAWDDKKEEFVTVGDVELDLEHSLVSLSKWESKWEKPFLSTPDKTTEQIVWYIKAMTITPDVPDDVYERLSDKNTKEIDEYITARMTATWFVDLPNQPPNTEIITAEIIYYWMIALNIPVKFETWHLNRLLTLIRVCNEKNAPKKKMSRSDAAARQRELNEERRRKYGTSG